MKDSTIKRNNSTEVAFKASKALFRKLEFDKILEHTRNVCHGDPGKMFFNDPVIYVDAKTIQDRLNEVYEIKRSIDLGEAMPIQHYESVDEDLKMLRIDAYVLDVEGIRRIEKHLQIIRELHLYFKGDRRQEFHLIWNLVSGIDEGKEILKAINAVLLPDGRVNPAASPELQKIHRKIQGKNLELDAKFRQLLNSYRKNGWLTDNVESVRNGRRVFSVPAEHKRKIRGIIHDESGSGKTAFIEPDAIIAINNDIFDLQQAERREIYKLLKELCDVLRQHIEVIEVHSEFIPYFDTQYAKARLAVQMDAYQPRAKEGSHLHLVKARHPLLYMQYKKAGKETIPFDLKLFGANRILILSGPNAGGKTVTMKTVGLLQLMYQSGMLVPVDPATEMGIFRNILVDIGDEQSLENELSTYSSRLKHMREFLEEAGKDVLVLIDEFGSGTDPKFGGAIAEALLAAFNRRRVYGVITTHYPNLKMYAFKKKGVVNGSMSFDKKSLSPTYKLVIGRPGSSYAFEVAEQSGLPGDILKYARKRGGKIEGAVDQLLIDLQQDKEQLEKRINDLEKKEEKVDRLIKTYEQLQKDLDVRRKRLKLESKERKLQEAAKSNREVEELIRKLKEEKNIEKAKELSRAIKEERKELSKDVNSLEEKVYHADQKESKRPIREGDYVKLKKGGSVGQVISIDRKKARLQMGAMQVEAALRDLELTREPLPRNPIKGVKTQTLQKKLAFIPKVDIRGMRKNEAVQAIEDFVDQALIHDSHLLEIVHGKGNGVLRQSVLMKLREYDAIKDVHHPVEEQGGDGVTIVRLD